MYVCTYALVKLDFGKQTKMSHLASFIFMPFVVKQQIEVNILKQIIMTSR